MGTTSLAQRSAPAAYGRTMSSAASPSPGPLSRGRIVAAAIALVDQDGMQALSMRRLGHLLGVEGMAIYHHVNGREDLLEAMVEQVVADVRVPPREPIGPADGWQAFLIHVAHAIRSIAEDHPHLFPLVATRPPAAPWLRPPLRSLGLVEDFLDGLTARGLPDDHAVHVYKAFTGFLLGHLLLEVAERNADTGPPDEPLNEGGADVETPDSSLSLDDFPTVRRLQPRLTEHNARAEFERALESLLNRLDHDVSQ